ncbi:hypothetical protein pb186bvf_014952 [Paramecium bursaria]
MKKLDDQKREDSLFNYLNKSYGEYQKGQQSSMNKIIDEVSRKNKDVVSIQQWANLLTRLLVQTAKQGEDPMMIIDIVLYKIPWLTSENHFEAIWHFKKFVHIILSQNSINLQAVYKLLISRFQLTIQHESVKIDQEMYNRQLANDLVHAIIARQSISTEKEMKILDQKDKQIMMKILKNHPKASQKMSHMQDIGYGYFPELNKSACFYIIKSDKEFIDISYVKALDGMFDEQFRQNFQITTNPYTEEVLNMIVEIDTMHKLNRGKLIEVINDHFPHKNQNDMVLRQFAINILRLAERIPDIASKIIRILFQKILSIDSEVKPDTHHNTIIIKTKVNPKQAELKDDMSKKLDQLMNIIFEFLQSKTGSGVSQCFRVEQNDDIIISTFKELQVVFQEVVLKNHHYRMAHYLFFFFCSMEDRYKICQQQFITQLIQNIKSVSLQKLQKINSIYYFSSLLIRCNKISTRIFDKAIQIILDFCNDDSRKREPIIDNHLAQMLAYMISTYKLEPFKKQIYETILKTQKIHSALKYFHYDILVKFNGMLLKDENNSITQQLIEITATEITTHMKTRCPSDYGTSQHSPNTPFIGDHESLLSRQSVWTNLSKQANNLLDFHQPFSIFMMAASSSYIKQHYRSDSELIQQELDQGEAPLKKVKCI